MKLRQFEDLTPQEQGMVILIDYLAKDLRFWYDNNIWLKARFNELIDAPTLGEFDWKTHRQRKENKENQSTNLPENLNQDADILTQLLSLKDKKGRPIVKGIHSPGYRGQ